MPFLDPSTWHAAICSDGWHRAAGGDEAVVRSGGVGASGTGSRFGRAAANADAFSRTQWLTVQRGSTPHPL